jgi:uncharacterized protein (DUF433 family)
MKTLHKKARFDPREVSAYGISEAAFYLMIPRSTLRAWVMGCYYPTSRGRSFFRPVIEISDHEGARLSFINLVEAHVLGAIRREHRVSLPKVRKAVKYLEKKFGTEHPLADKQLTTDGLDLFVEEYGRLVNISRQGQMEMKEILAGHLRRIKRDRHGIPIKLYLFTRMYGVEQPFTVVIDPSVSFGRPVLEGTGVVTTILAERFKAGEKLESLARDYDRPKEEIEEALRYEIRAA